jgi:fimbrial isopeptide formation D2 family protein/LPXTG-motif cell wall-anchored protein
MMFFSNRTRVLRTVSALAGAAMLALTAGPASAATGPLVDPSATGALTVHKYAQPDARGLVGDGTELTSEETAHLTPLADVDFTIAKVDGVDLTTNLGWEAAAAHTTASARASLGATTTITTGADGVAAFADLPLGLYLVSETNTPAGVTPAADFLVTLPLTDPVSGSSWVYDVHVYPKNSVVGSEKTVEDTSAVTLGDELVWTILSDIPQVDVIDGYKIVDPLDAKLDHTSTAVRLVDAADSTTAWGTQPVEGTHYTLVETDNVVTVEFNQAGRELLAAHQGARVEVVITTTVNTVGEIVNEALIYPNAASFDITPGEDGGPFVPPVAISKFGVITLEKVDSADDSTLLPGATFQVFATEQDAEDRTNPITINSVSSWTTGTDGRLVISGLRYSSWANGAELSGEDDPSWKSYYLVETTAPDGYELLAAPVKVHVTSDDPALVTVTVKNIESNAGFNLPFTGGSGTTFVTAAGVLILLGSVVTVVTRRRRAIDA